MNPTLLLLAAAAGIAVVALLVRLAASAVQRCRVVRERRTGEDRRRTELPVPMERRHSRRRR